MKFNSAIISGLSLTVLLVMYTLYQSVSLSISQTAYLKMIDYWLLFCLIIPFIVFLMEMNCHLKGAKFVEKCPKNSKSWMKEDEVKKLSYQKRGMCIIPLFTLVFSGFYIVIAIVMYNVHM